uniref:Uncharacterized protein n=1 Tax=Arundo donax TaxID=35708 RepID=A0A0A9E160_ARUDO
MQNHGGRLYITKTTGQQLYLELNIPYGLNPSVAKPNRIFRESDPKCGYLSSKLFHALESAGCRNASSLMHSSSCHRRRGAVSLHINNLFSLCLTGKYRNTLLGIAFFLSFVVNLVSGSLSFHLETLQVEQKSSSTLSFQNS